MISNQRRLSPRSLGPAGVLAALLAIPSCAPRDAGSPSAGPGSAAPSPGLASPASSASTLTPLASAAADAPVVLFVGTSLTAGLGLLPEQAFPGRIQERIATEGLSYRVVNAGVSGETSAGALRRMDWLLREPVAVLVLETGANDGLRGQDVEATRANIQGILDRVGRATPPPRVLLLGMEAPPNLGSQYAQRFRGIFPELARKNHVAFVPFLLEGVAGVADLNQADAIHPTAEGHRKVAETVWRALRPLLAPSRPSPRSGP